MASGKLLGGIVALGVLTIGASADAQDAATSGTEPPARSYAAGAAGQESPASCSGLGCLFHWHLDRQDTPPSPGTAPVASAGSAPRTAKPVRAVTIAADPLEAGRLKRLAAALPKQRIRIVERRGTRDRSAADFSVAASLEARADAERTRLFTEQMHILAGAPIHSLSDLDGKVVSFGPDKSPGQVAARTAFASRDIHVKETPLDLDNALDGLATGDVDAVVLLAPQPVQRLQAVATPGVHLVSWPETGDLPAGATAATIGAEAYPRLLKPGESVRTLGVDATLKASARGAKDEAGKSFLKALSENSDALSKRGFDLIRAEADTLHTPHLASARAE